MAVATRRQRLISVDTNVLIDLADGSADVERSLAAIRKRLPGALVVVTPTVVQELAFLADCGEDEETRWLATIAAYELRSRWAIQPINCDAEWHGVIELAGQELRDRGLLPADQVNDSLIVAESALAECALLVSSDAHMWDADINSVNEVLVRRHLNALVIAAPWKIAKDYG